MPFVNVLRVPGAHWQGYTRPLLQAQWPVDVVITMIVANRCFFDREPNPRGASNQPSFPVPWITPPLLANAPSLTPNRMRVTEMGYMAERVRSGMFRDETLIAPGNRRKEGRFPGESGA